MTKPGEEAEKKMRKQENKAVVDLTIKNLADWHIPYENKLFIAGPCSVESEEQVLQTALSLKQQPVNVLRGGIWKPRTRPGQFQGIGHKGLRWLKNAGKDSCTSSCGGCFS